LILQATTRLTVWAKWLSGRDRVVHHVTFTAVMTRLRPQMYGTTKKFLQAFGLNTLKDLPEVESLRPPL
jgi:hypothetical protein